MLFNSIKESIHNRNNYIKTEGKAYYYSKQILVPTLIIQSILCIVCFLFFFEGWIGFLGGISYLFFILYKLSVEIIPRLLYNVPLFIVKKDELYYTKQKKWYNLTSANVVIFEDGRHNTFGTLKITEGNSDIGIKENLWYISDDELLKAHLRKIKNVDSLDEDE
jgi:hypothetical protein